MHITYGLAVLGGILAAVVSWVFNGKILTIFDNNKAVIFIGPAIEELLKTGLALVLAAPLIISHAVFGLVEAIWEFSIYKKGAVAGLLAVLSHLFYGFLTMMVAEKVRIVIALIVAYTAHMLWNYLVIHYQRSRVY